MLLYIAGAIAILAVVGYRMRQFDAYEERKRISRARIQDWQNHPHDTPHERPAL